MKDKLKLLVNPFLFHIAKRHKTSTVVASMGRSGSTMLCRAACKGLLGFDDSFLNHKVSNQYLREAWDLKNDPVETGFVYKTHDFPVIRIADKYKCIFTYADPLEIVASVIQQTQKHGKGWFKEHLEHLKQPQEELDSIFEADILGIEKQFDTWTASKEKNVMSVHYKHLWDHKNEVDKFLGYKIILPPKRNRKSSIESLSQDQRNKLEKTYKDIQTKIAQKTIWL